MLSTVEAFQYFCSEV